MESTLPTHPDETLTRTEMNALHKRKAQSIEVRWGGRAIILDGVYYHHVLPYLRTVDHHTLHVAYHNVEWHAVEKTPFEANAVQWAGRLPPVDDSVDSEDQWWVLHHPDHISTDKDWLPPLARTVAAEMAMEDTEIDINRLMQCGRTYDDIVKLRDRVLHNLHLAGINREVHMPNIETARMASVALLIHCLSSLEVRLGVPACSCTHMRDRCSRVCVDSYVFSMIEESNIPKIAVWSIHFVNSIRHALMDNPGCTHIAFGEVASYDCEYSPPSEPYIYGDVPHVHMHIMRHLHNEALVRVQVYCNTIDTLLITSRRREHLEFTHVADTAADRDQLRRVIIMYSNDTISDTMALHLSGADSAEILRDKDVWIHQHVPVCDLNMGPERSPRPRDTTLYVDHTNPDWARITAPADATDLCWFPLSGPYTRLWHSPAGSSDYTISDNIQPIMNELTGYPHIHIHNYYWK